MREAKYTEVEQRRQAKVAKAVEIGKNTKNLKLCISLIIQSAYQMSSKVDILSESLTLLSLVDYIII